MRFLKSIGKLSALCWIASILAMGFLFAAFFVHAKLSDYQERLELSRRVYSGYRLDVLRGEVETAARVASSEYELRLAELSSKQSSPMSGSARKLQAEKDVLARLAAYRLGRGSGGDVFVLNHYGALLLAPQGEKDAAEKLDELNGAAYKRLLEDARKPEGAFAELLRSKSGKTDTFFAKRIEKPEWIVCASVPDSELALERSEDAMALRSKLLVDLAFILLAAGLVVVGALWLSWGVSRLIRREIDMLVSYCKGSSSERARLSENDFRFVEFRIIAASLTGMVKSIGALVGTVKELALKSESGNQAKGGFIASVCRDIATPLNSILDMTRILKDSHLDRAQRECVEAIDVSAQSIARLSSEMRAYSVDEGGRLLLHERLFDLARLAHDVVSVVEPLAKESGDNVVLSLPSAYPLPPLLKGDNGKLSRVLRTLLANAIKFTKNGQVELAIAIEGRSLDGRTLYKFKVSDSGLGISHEKLKRIFEMSSDTVGGRFGGVGLGLAVSKALVETMGGSIDAASEKGKGSTFSFCIPLSDA